MLPKRPVASVEPGRRIIRDRLAERPPMHASSSTFSSPSTQPAQIDARPAALVFTRAVLPRSETFVEDHIRSLSRYRPTLAGLAPVADGLKLPGIDVRMVGRRGSGLERLSLAFSPLRGALDRVVADTNPAVLHAHFVSNALLL